MITIGGKTCEWREGLTVDSIVRELGGADGASIASIEDTSAAGIRRSFINRMDWSTTELADGAKISFVVIASGG